MKKVSLIIVGAGGRGTGYATYAGAHPDQLEIVGVAEPREYYRNNLQQKYSIPEGNVYKDWKEIAAREKFADGVIIATQDNMHAEPAIAFAKKGYHMLLEKPMAPNENDCRRIVKAVTDAKIIFAVCHVLRYTTYTQKIIEMINNGLLGDIVTIQHLEPVGYWHQAHSFVRGNWRNEAESSPMLLAKSCHDLDWIRYVMGESCKAVSSFGTLKHFRREEKPVGGGTRCIADCAVEKQCPYSAKKIYLGMVERGETWWPVDVITPVPTVASVTEALQKGPYGRCVYECDNDVVDNQVVGMAFDKGKTASFTMTAFTAAAHRKTHICGTRGHIHGDGRSIVHFDFLTDKTTAIDTEAGDATLLGGHGGGDYGLMKAFVGAIANNDPSRVLSGPAETLESHLMVFAAEKARLGKSVVDIRL